MYDKRPEWHAIIDEFPNEPKIKAALRNQINQKIRRRDALTAEIEKEQKTFYERFGAL